MGAITGVAALEVATWSGSVTAAPDPSVGTATVAKDLRVRLSLLWDTKVVQETTYIVLRHTAYLPDDPGAPGDAGRLSLSGTIALAGAAGTPAYTVGADPANPLHWSRACAAFDDALPGFDAGTVHYLNQQGETVLTVAYPGCAPPRAQPLF